jgi:parallel beta-helix repeat protein
MLTLLLVSVIASASKVRPTGAQIDTVYIRVDGSVEGTAYVESSDNITYVLTGDLNESVVVERSSIVIDGNGHTLNGSGLASAGGFCLTNVNDVTIRKTNIVGFGSGIIISQSSGSVIVENNITNSPAGISMDSQSSKNIISRNRIADVGTGVFSGMGASSNVISENTIQDERYYGIRPSGFNNVVSKNNISAHVSHGDHAGIYLEDSIYTVVSRNRIENSSIGIWVGDWAENDNISGNAVVSSHYGMHLTALALYNHIQGNSVEGTEMCSIVSYASYNYIYHNNIIADSARAVQIVDGFSFWDDGYPSGGNHWSFLGAVDADVYSGVHQNETGSDGILEHSFVIQGRNIDHYPLAGSFNTFYAGTWNETEYDFDVVSNFTVTNCNFNLTANPPTLSLDLEGKNSTNGFCRVTIPKNVMWCDNPDQWIITAGNYAILQRKVIEEGDHTYVCFTYNQPNGTVLVQSTHAIPEFSLQIIMLLLMAVTAQAIVRRKKKCV